MSPPETSVDETRISVKKLSNSDNVIFTLSDITCFNNRFFVTKLRCHNFEVREFVLCKKFGTDLNYLEESTVSPLFFLGITLKIHSNRCQPLLIQYN